MTTDHGLPTEHAKPWLHAWAVLTVCATMLLLLLGSVVTTFKVGMADPIWPTYPWHLLLISWEEPSAGFLIEHSHRLAGYIVGCCIIVLTVGLCLQHGRLRWLGIAALGAVIVQGLLGGFRVKLHALMGTNLALIHGCFAQVVFALLVSLAVLTSSGGDEVVPASNRVRRWSLLVTLLVFLQIGFGAWIRHKGSPLGERGHLLIAFAVVAAVAALAQAIFTDDAREKRLTRPVTILAALVVVQLILGVETWLLRASAGRLPELQPLTIPHALLRTAHVLVGSLILASAVVVTLQAQRRTAWVGHTAPQPSPRLEGAV